MQIEKNRQATENKKLGLAENADARAAGQEQRVLDEYNYQLEQRTLGSKVAAEQTAIEGMGTQVTEAQQGALGRYAGEAKTYSTLSGAAKAAGASVNTPFGKIPTVAQTFSKLSEAQLILGPRLSPQEQVLVQQYEDRLTAAEKLAQGLSGEQQTKFREWARGRALQDLDSSGRLSFAASVADRMAAGAYTPEDNFGQPVNDPQIAAKIQQLLEATQDPRAALADLRRMEQSILDGVAQQNIKADNYQSAALRLAQTREMGRQTNNPNVTQATVYAQNLLKAGVEGKELSEAMDNAAKGLIARKLTDGSEFVAPAVGFEEAFKNRQIEVDAFNKAKTDATEARAALESMAAAPKLKLPSEYLQMASKAFENLDDANKARALGRQEIVGEDGQKSLTAPTISAQDFVKNLAQQYRTDDEAAIQQQQQAFEARRTGQAPAQPAATPPAAKPATPAQPATKQAPTVVPKTDKTASSAIKSAQDIPKEDFLANDAGFAVPKPSKELEQKVQKQLVDKKLLDPATGKAFAGKEQAMAGAAMYLLLVENGYDVRFLQTDNVLGLPNGKWVKNPQFGNATK
jgi:transcription elongation GreA/GreB family factor